MWPVGIYRPKLAGSTPEASCHAEAWEEVRLRSREGLAFRASSEAPWGAEHTIQGVELTDALHILRSPLATLQRSN